MRSLRLVTAAIVLAFAALFLSLGAPSPRASEHRLPDALAGTVYTADEQGNSISAINLRSRKVSTVGVPISPHNVQITSDGARLLAVGDPAAEGHAHGNGKAEHAANEGKGRLIVFDLRQPTLRPAFSVEVGTHPAHVVVDRAGHRAFVTNAGDNSVAEVDLARRRVLRTVTTGRYPHGLRLSPDGRQLYVANVQDGSVSVIDTASFVEVARIPVGQAPVQVGFTPDGARAYVSLRDENSVAIVDVATRTKIGSVAVGRGPIQVHATPDGRFVYVANQGSEAEPADTVSVIEVGTGSVVETIRTGAGAHGVAVSDDGKFVFITNIAAGTVSVIEAARRSVVAEFRVGKGPNGITFRPPGG